MDKACGKNRFFNACRCKDAGATNKRKPKTSGKKCRTPTADKKEHELDNNHRGTTESAILPVRTSTTESVVYLGTFDGNSICCSIIDLTCSPTCLVVKQENNSNKRRLPISATSINKFQEHRHHFHSPPPLIVHQGGEYHQGFRTLRPRSFTAEQRKPSGGPKTPKCRPSLPVTKDYCHLEPGCLCTVLNKMPLDLSFSINEDTVLEQILEKERDLVPLLEDLNVTELMESSMMPFSLDGLLEMYRVNVTDTFSS